MAAALVGGAFLSAFLQVLFDRMATPEFLNLFRQRKHDDKLLQKLTSNLLVVEAVLEDAENKETSNQAVKRWLDKLHDTVLEADDLLDKINTEALRVKMETEYYQSANKQVGSSTCILSLSNQLLDEIMPEIENVVVTLDGFIQQIMPLGLQAGNLKKLSHRQPSTSLVDETTYGRDGNKEKIIELLLSEDMNRGSITVVPIVGLGGIGKTTLAQLVYNDERVKNHFSTKAWVCVSEEYDASRITKELLGELKISFSDLSETLNSLQVKLQTGLTDKRFLLVLDDVWNSDYIDWNNLRILFKGGLRGSKIIVTTRDQNVAKMMAKEEYIHNLDLISEEDSWSIFEKHAFENKDDNQNPEFEEIGKRIVKKCGGLPLAVKTVAGLLRSKITVEEWEDILASEVWSQSKSQGGILPALRLSYIHLPSYLKRCFAYCALFHKDYNFTKEEVLQLWLANDLLKHPGDNRSGNMGEECFSELRSRSLFQQSHGNFFTMHDLVNDLARSISGKYCLKLEDYHQGQGTIARFINFSYNPSYKDTFAKFKPLEEAKELRTFHSLSLSRYRGSYHLSNKILHDMLPSFKALRALSLSHYRTINKLTNSFSGLKQLRYLNLSSTNIQKLPKWIYTMYNLHTLLLNYCNHLKELPKDLGKLTNLSYLDISEVPLKKMPKQMGRLRNLRVLTAFVLEKDNGSIIKELGKFSKLQGKLFLSGLENISSDKDASMANMKDKKQLEDLILKWHGNADNSCVARDVLDSLEPHSSIKHLTINGYCGTRFSNWLGSLSFDHMKSLRLYNCEYCFSLPALGQLKALETLEIDGMSNISVLSEEMYGDSCEMKLFPSLKRFKIKNMRELERWDVPECEIFCNLEELYIFTCPKLVGNFLQQLTSLQILEISGCDKLVLSDGRLSIFNGDIQQLSSLAKLTILSMETLKELLPGLNLLANLKRLKIRQCESLLPNMELETCDQNESLLESLELIECDSLEIVSLCPTLKHVEISNCKRIEMLSIQSGGRLTSLQTLKIRGCGDLMSFPEEGFSAPKLRLIDIQNCEKLKSLPKRMDSLFPSLQQLFIFNCPEIDCFSEGGLPSTLQTLEIYHCPQIECFPAGGSPSTLQNLTIYNCEKLLKSLREKDLQRLSSLRRLTIGPIDEETFPNEDWLLPCTLEYLDLLSKNLKMLNYSGLRHLISLQRLVIVGCHLLQSLPDEGLPASLTTLIINNCPLLNPRLEWEKGADWPKVARIPCVEVDCELVP